MTAYLVPLIGCEAGMDSPRQAAESHHDDGHNPWQLHVVTMAPYTHHRG